MGVSCAAHAGGAKKEAATAMARADGKKEKKTKVAMPATVPRTQLLAAGGRPLAIGGVVVVLLVAAIVFLRPSGGSDVSGESAGWTALPAAGVEARTAFSTVSTGRAAIVWGGSGANTLNDGASFDTATSEWKKLAAAPIVARRDHTAVWTGSKMVIFGGLARGADCKPSCVLNDGAAYDPATDRWAPIAPAPLAGRNGHSAVYFQNRMVIWGGTIEGGKAVVDGASYDPETDAWTMLPPAPLEPRVGFRTVASTHRMLVWGGSSGTGQDGKYFSDGAVYSVANNAWTPMARFPETKEGGGRDNFSSVWTGEKMLVWGGFSRNATCNPCSHSDGAAYDMVGDTWTLMSPGPLAGRGAHRAVWAGDQMVVWGGFNTTELKDGATYDPKSDTWTALSGSPLLPRQGQGMVMAGDRVVIWGGHGPHGEGVTANPNHEDGALLKLA